MLKYTLKHLLMAMALAAIFVLFTQSEGCGKRVRYIDSLSFNADETQIVVSTIAARVQHSPPTEFRHYSRTISLLDRKQGNFAKVVHQDYKEQIPYSGPGDINGSAIFNPANDRVAAIEFDGGRMRLDVESPRWLSCIEFPVQQMMFSRSGKYLAAYTTYGVAVVDVASEEIAINLPLNGLNSFRMLSYPHKGNNVQWCMFSDDETRLIVSSENKTDVWDIDAALPVSSTKSNFRDGVTVLAPGPGNTIFVYSNGVLEQSDIVGNKIAEISVGNGNYDSGRISPDSSTFVACRMEAVDVFDMENNKLQTTFPLDQVEALALSHNGNVVALGSHGKVQLVDTTTGKMIWHATPPIRFSTPLTVPAAFFVAWIVVARIKWQIDRADRRSMQLMNTTALNQAFPQ